MSDTKNTPLGELPLNVLSAALQAAQPLASAEKLQADYDAFRERMIASMQHVVEYRDRQWEDALDKALPGQKKVVRLAIPVSH